MRGRPYFFDLLLWLVSSVPHLNTHTYAHQIQPSFNIGSQDTFNQLTSTTTSNIQIAIHQATPHHLFKVGLHLRKIQYTIGCTLRPGLTISVVGRPHQQLAICNVAFILSICIPFYTNHVQKRSRRYPSIIPFTSILFHTSHHRHSQP